MKMTFGIPLDALLYKKSTFFEETNRQPPFSPERFSRWFPLLANLAADRSWSSDLLELASSLGCNRNQIVHHFSRLKRSKRNNFYISVPAIYKYIQVYMYIIYIYLDLQRDAFLNPKGWWIDTLGTISSAARWSLPILWSHQWLSGGAQLNGAVFLWEKCVIICHILGLLYHPYNNLHV